MDQIKDLLYWKYFIFKFISSLILILPLLSSDHLSDEYHCGIFFSHQEGDRVYVCGSLTGTYAEFALCNASSVHLMPDNVSFSQGAAIYVPYYTAYRALFQRCGMQ